jgi:hypothetical protein
MEQKRLDDVIAAIDAANAQDPNRVEVDGEPQPAGLVYGRRMSAMLARVAPDASEHLRIAARGQHVERWTWPRADFPPGRMGYLTWRKELQKFHAARVGELMAAADYEADDIARVGALVGKEQLRADAEAQILEDVACLVFLAHEFSDFMAKTDADKLSGILAKTWKKMSPRAREQALEVGLPPAVPALLAQGLAQGQFSMPGDT